jgi:hypothetical protein
MALLKYDGGAEFLKVAESTIKSAAWRRRHGVPVVKIGRNVRFDPSALAAFVAAQTRVEEDAAR